MWGDVIPSEEVDDLAEIGLEGLSEHVGCVERLSYRASSMATTAKAAATIAACAVRRGAGARVTVLLEVGRRWRR